MLIIFICLKLRKKQRDYKRSSWLQTMETKTTVTKKKKKTTILNYLFFITIFSFAGALVDWESAASEAFGPYP